MQLNQKLDAVKKEYHNVVRVEVKRQFQYLVVDKVPFNDLSPSARLAYANGRWRACWLHRRPEVVCVHCVAARY